jgi:hypothetical protein
MEDDYDSVGPKTYGFIGFLVGMVIALLLAVLIKNMNDNSHEMQNLCISKEALVRAGVAEWRYDKRFVLKKETAKFYKFSEVKQ